MKDHPKFTVRYANRHGHAYAWVDDPGTELVCRAEDDEKAIGQIVGELAAREGGVIVLDLDSTDEYPNGVPDWVVNQYAADQTP